MSHDRPCGGRYAGDGSDWQFHNVAASHNRLLQQQQQGAAFLFPPGLAFAHEVAAVTNASSPAALPQGRQTEAYTSLVELAPTGGGKGGGGGGGGAEATALLFYDRLRVGCPESAPSEAWCQGQGLGYDGGTDYVLALRLRVARGPQPPAPPAPPAPPRPAVPRRRFLSFYGFEPEAQAGWLSFATGHATLAQQLAAFRQYGLPSLYGQNNLPGVLRSAAKLVS